MNPHDACAMTDLVTLLEESVLVGGVLLSEVLSVLSALLRS